MAEQQPQAFVYDAIRTPRGRGKKNGSLHEVKPVDLVVGLLDEVRTRNPGLDPDRVDDVVLGVVTPVGDQGGDIAKTAALAAGLPRDRGRACSSTASAPPAWRPSTRPPSRVRSGWEDLILAGGVESMSRVPMGSDGGAWAMDPRTTCDTSFVPAGHRRRPDRHPRGLRAATTSTPTPPSRRPGPPRRRPTATSTGRSSRSRTSTG